MFSWFQVDPVEPRPARSWIPLLFALTVVLLFLAIVYSIVQWATSIP